jgi:uncharacterized protein YifE (UPF0438 family)
LRILQTLSLQKSKEKKHKSRKSPEGKKYKNICRNSHTITKAQCHWKKYKEATLKFRIHILQTVNKNNEAQDIYKEQDEIREHVTLK